MVLYNGIFVVLNGLISRLQYYGCVHKQSRSIDVTQQIHTRRTVQEPRDETKNGQPAVYKKLKGQLDNSHDKNDRMYLTRRSVARMHT